MFVEQLAHDVGVVITLYPRTWSYGATPANTLPCNSNSRFKIFHKCCILRCWRPAEKCGFKTRIWTIQSVTDTPWFFFVANGSFFTTPRFLCETVSSHLDFEMTTALLINPVQHRTKIEYPDGFLRLKSWVSRRLHCSIAQHLDPLVKNASQFIPTRPTRILVPWFFHVLI